VAQSNYKTDREGTRKVWSTSSPFPGPPASTTATYARYSDDLHLSQGHPYHKLGKSDGDIGGSFLAMKRTLTEGGNSQNWDFHVGTSAFQGGQYAWVEKVDNSRFPTVIPSPSSLLNALGTQVIANVIPTNPLSGLLSALYEIRREGIPSVPGIQSWRDRTLRAKNAGSEYLNYEFGWLPLVNDLKRFSNSVTNSHELIRQYERNSGRRIKRRVTLPSTSEVIQQTDADAWPAPTVTGSLGNALYNGRGKISRTVTETTRRWFSGCFTYYLPPYKPGGDNLKRNEQLANYLYGTRVTPDTIWNLTPWTWALDWVANTGDVIHNISAFHQDGLVMPYAYIMEEKTIMHRVRQTQSFKQGLGNHTFVQDFETISKYRIPATPYGFGLNPATFSDRQWSILVALGLSRGGKQMMYQ
jgi:hypothetical protein